MQNRLQHLSPEYRSMLSGLATNYSTVVLVDVITQEYLVVKATNLPTIDICMAGYSVSDLDGVTTAVLSPNYRVVFDEYTKVETLTERLKDTASTPPLMVKTMIGDSAWRSIQWLEAGRDQSGNITRAFFVVKDIDDDKRRHNQEMKEMADIMDMASMGVWHIEIFDMEMPRMKGSPKMLELLGLDPTVEYSQEKVYEVWHSNIFPEALPSVNNSVAKMMRGFIDENTYKWNHPKFGMRYVRCGGTAYRVPGRGHVIVGYHYDVTEQVTAEKDQVEKMRRTIEANKAKTMLLQNMSHEIRTPINAMFGFSQLLGMPDGSITPEEKQEYMNHIENSFNMLSMIVDDVLDITDAEHGNYRVKMEKVAVNKICRNAVQLAETRLSGNVVMKFTSEINDDYTIESDGKRIQQVLINYLTNACKHTREGEILLHVSTSETPGKLTFSVTDTGEGVPEEMAADIFKRFKKLDNLVSGSGLGLNICNTIAEKLNGEVKLDTSYKNGARFVFIL